MNPLHVKCIANYLKGMSKEQAMLAVGYSPGYAAYPKDIFNLPSVKKEIEKRQKMALDRAQVTEDYIVKKLVAIAEANLGDIVTTDDNGKVRLDYSKLSSDLRYALSGLTIEESMKGRGDKAEPVVKIKVTVADKLRAIEMLGKYLGMFKEKVEVSGDALLIEQLQRGRERVATKGNDG